MDQVKSYWQIAGIHYFTSLFGKRFKLPEFEPEELEQAFLLDVPEPKDVTNEQPDDEQHEQHEQPELHLLVKLAISFLKPHFTTRITHLNWEAYLRRLIDNNWVELENYPSPFYVPIISKDGVELTKNLTFNELPLSDKIDIFYALCDYRLWAEVDADVWGEFSLNELRLESIGKDSQGFEYWYFSGTRLYKENKELSQDLTMRKKRIKELEYQLIELEKSKIFREQEEKRKAEIERVNALKRQQQEEQERERKLQQQQQKQQRQQTSSSKKRKVNTPVLPPRTGLRERRSSVASNTNNTSTSNNLNDNSNQSTNRASTRSITSTSTPNRSTSIRSCRLQQQKLVEEEKLKKQQISSQKTSRGKSSRNSTASNDEDTEIESQDEDQTSQPKRPQKQNTRSRNPSTNLPKLSPEEECKAELERLTITQEARDESWSIACESLEEWEEFATKFQHTKSTNERYLHNYVNDELLPIIRAMYAKRAADARRKEKEMLLSLASRRVSSRIISKRAQEEEEERKAKEQEVELRQKRVLAETRLRQELEREMKERKKAMLQNGHSNGGPNGAEASATPDLDPTTAPSSVGPESICSQDGFENEYNGRYNLRQQSASHHRQHQNGRMETNHLSSIVDDDLLGDSDEFEGLIRPSKLSEFYEAIELVIDTVRTSKHAWPFVDPVPNTVPGYYDLIKQPMDLKKIRTKVEFREYRSLLELEKDFQLLVNNCEEFNGPKNVYTKMVYKLWKSFRKNTRLYLQRDLSMNEYDTFLYPPAPPKPPTPEPVLMESEPQPKHEPQDTEEPSVKVENTETAGEKVEEPVTKTEGTDSKMDLQLEPPNCELKLQINLPQPQMILPQPQINLPHSLIDVAKPETTGSSEQVNESKPDGVRPGVKESKAPSPSGEEIIIDSYDIPCPDTNLFIWPLEKDSWSENLES